jgi:hypothetical protein
LGIRDQGKDKIQYPQAIVLIIDKWGSGVGDQGSETKTQIQYPQAVDLIENNRGSGV